MAPTPAIAAAERAGIAFTLHEYEHDPAAESYGLEAAEKLGVDPARVFKTLVVSVDGELEVALVPVARAARPEGARQARTDGRPGAGRARDRLRDRRHQPARPAQAAADAPRRLGARPRAILVSAGRRGLQIELEPDDLVALTGARVHPIARD